MLIVKVLGGLGNQMYCYGLYRKYQTLGKTAKLDISGYIDDYKIFPYELDRIFNVETCYADANEIKLMNDKTNITHKILRKLRIIKRKCINVDPKNQYLPKVFDFDNVYLNGYWSSFDYFTGIESLLKKEFTFKLPLEARNAKVVEAFQSTNSIAIHVRRGDYLQYTHIYEILTAEYYNKAIRYINDRIENPFYYCFSNDINWCQMNLECKNLTFIDWNTGEDSFRDMQLMSLCKHIIVANSTFSIWAAWLNSNSSKIVIRPKDFFCDNTYNTDHFWPSEWVSIDNK